MGMCSERQKEGDHGGTGESEKYWDLWDHATFMLLDLSRNSKFPSYITTAHACAISMGKPLRMVLRKPARSLYNLHGCYPNTPVPFKARAW